MCSIACLKSRGSIKVSYKITIEARTTEIKPSRLTPKLEGCSTTIWAIGKHLSKPQSASATGQPTGPGGP